MKVCEQFRKTGLGPDAWFGSASAFKNPLITGLPKIRNRSMIVQIIRIIRAIFLFNGTLRPAAKRVKFAG